MTTTRLRWQVTDDRLTEIIRGPASEAGAMATELRDLRAASVADKQRVREVVRAEAYGAIHPDTLRAFDVCQLADAIADRAAEQLKAPAARDADLVRSVVREACQRFGYTLRTPDIDCIVERVVAGLCKEAP